MAKNPFRSRAVPSPVQAEFGARADGTKLLKWTAQRFPWIYVMTCAGGCDSLYDEFGNDPTGTAKGSLKMFDTNPSKGAYEKGTNVPLPGVTGLDVKAMGSLGTTRKATITMTAYTDDQLVKLQKCYFIPGMDIRVQWGWNKSCDGTTPPPPMTEDCSQGTVKAVCKLNKKRAENSNFDGFQGIVGNFKYNLTKENTWDISIEVISAADPFTTSKIGNTTCPCAREVETDQGETVKDFGPIYAALADIHNEGRRAARRLMTTLSGARGSNRSNHGWCIIEYEGVQRTEVAQDQDGGWFSGWFSGDESTEAWISFGAFIDMLNVMSIPHLEDEPDGKKFPFGIIDCSNVELALPLDKDGNSIAMSSDLRVCYLGGGALPERVFNRVEEGSILNCIENDKVVLDKIMCNVPFLLKEYKQVYDGNGQIKTLVDNVLNQINRACGSPWTFVTVATGDDCDGAVPPGPSLTMLDEKQAMEQTAAFPIPSLVGDSTLRDFSLTMKMSSAQKTQALYAGNSQVSKKDVCEGAAFAPFYTSQGAENKAKPKPSTAKVNCNKCEESAKSADPPTKEDLIENLRSETNGQTVAAMAAWLQDELSNSDTKMCAGVPLPFDFSFTIDGISGFEFGQMITSTRIPEAIRKNFQWQVTKVEHKISVNDWETSVSTVCRANPYGKDPKAKKATSTN